MPLRRDVVRTAVEARIDDDARLQFADARDGEDVAAVGMRRPAIEPHHIDLAVAGQQFLDLPAHHLLQCRVMRRDLLRRTVHDARFVVGAEFRQLAAVLRRRAAVDVVHERAVKVPVRPREVETHFQTRGAAALDELLHEIAPVHRRVLRVEAAIGRRPQREPVVMLRGQHGVFEARRLRPLQPDLGMVVRRVELLRERPVFVRRDLRLAPCEVVVLLAHNPRELRRIVPDDTRRLRPRQARAGNHRPGGLQRPHRGLVPMQEKPQARLGKPLRIGMQRVRTALLRLGDADRRMLPFRHVVSAGDFQALEKGEGQSSNDWKCCAAPVLDAHDGFSELASEHLALAPTRSQRQCRARRLKADRSGRGSSP